VQLALEVFAVVLALAVAFVPRDRSLVRTCALGGAVTIAVQLPAMHWFYYYVMWFLPFALVAFLVPPGVAVASEQPQGGRGELDVLKPPESASELALAGV
jgi:hypothetical protein